MRLPHLLFLLVLWLEPPFRRAQWEPEECRFLSINSVNYLIIENSLFCLPFGSSRAYLDPETNLHYCFIDEGFNRTESTDLRCMDATGTIPPTTVPPSPANNMSTMSSSSSETTTSVTTTSVTTTSVTATSVTTTSVIGGQNTTTQDSKPSLGSSKATPDDKSTTSAINTGTSSTTVEGTKTSTTANNSTTSINGGLPSTTSGETTITSTINGFSSTSSTERTTSIITTTQVFSTTTTSMFDGRYSTRSASYGSQPIRGYYRKEKPKPDTSQKNRILENDSEGIGKLTLKWPSEDDDYDFIVFGMKDDFKKDGAGFCRLIQKIPEKMMELGPATNEIKQLDDCKNIEFETKEEMKNHILIRSGTEERIQLKQTSDNEKDFNYIILVWKIPDSLKNRRYQTYNGESSIEQKIDEQRSNDGGVFAYASSPDSTKEQVYNITTEDEYHLLTCARFSDGKIKFGSHINKSVAKPHLMKGWYEVMKGYLEKCHESL